MGRVRFADQRVRDPGRRERGRALAERGLVWDSEDDCVGARRRRLLERLCGGVNTLSVAEPTVKVVTNDDVVGQGSVGLIAALANFNAVVVCS